MFELAEKNRYQREPRGGFKLSLLGMTGLEPAASWSQTKHSTKLNYIPLTRHSQVKAKPDFIKWSFKDLLEVSKW